MEEATELMLMMDPPSGIFATRAFTIQNMLLTLMSMLLCKVEDLRFLNIHFHSCIERLIGKKPHYKLQMRAVPEMFHRYTRRCCLGEHN